MPGVADGPKHDAMNAIKKNMKTMNAVVLLVVYTLVFLNVKFLYKFLDYIPQASIVTMLTVVFALMIISYYLSRTIARSAINELDKYDRKLNNLLNSMKQEVKDRRKIELQLQRQVYYDQLTNLPNRKLFLKKLDRVSERRRKHDDYLFAILFMDVDNFKIVNDSLGHIIGDELLVSIAQRLQNCVRSVDTVARFGGDEFVILIDDIDDITDALNVADRIQKELKSPFKLSDQEVIMTASIGIVQNTMGYEKKEDFLRDADIAMYRAKANGKSRYEMFDSEMYDSIKRRLELERDLMKALENKEFLIHYQPIVSLPERKIVGAEALVRWQHPQYGLMLPDQFIAISENIGVIKKIGEWVLRKACEQNKVWHNNGYRHLRMDVNFSGRQFQEDDTLNTIETILSETDMAANFLDIEITESVAIEDHSIALLNKLSDLGVTTSIDDFGTGYSSLGALKRFPINNIKIDKSFVKEITKDADTETIVRAIIAMAHTLKIKIIAEGVETEAQLDFLQKNGCDEIQGFLCSPPVAEKEFTELLKQQRADKIECARGIPIKK